MAITDELAKDQRVTGKGECLTCTWIEAQPDASEWDEALAQSARVYSSPSILRLARKRGATFSLSSVKRCRTAGHRR